MTMASGEGKGSGRLVVPVVAYAFVLALLGWAGFFLRGPSSPPGSNRASSVISTETPAEPLHAVRGVDLPPRPAEASAEKETAQAPAVLSSPSPSEKSNSDVAASAEPTKKEPGPAAAASSQSENSNTDLTTSKQPEPPKTTCTVNVDRWPVDSTEQVKAIQSLMRDLGFYSGTTARSARRRARRFANFSSRPTRPKPASRAKCYSSRSRRNVLKSRAR